MDFVMLLHNVQQLEDMLMKKIVVVVVAVVANEQFETLIAVDVVVLVDISINRPKFCIEDDIAA